MLKKEILAQKLQKNSQKLKL